MHNFIAVIIIILIISSVQGIRNCVPETNHISRAYSVAAVLYLQIGATCNVKSPIMYVLYFYISTSFSVCAVPNMTVFCGFLISCFLGMLIRYCLCDFEMVPVALI
jgi:hypothetical protein